MKFRYKNKKQKHWQNLTSFGSSSSLNDWKISWFLCQMYLWRFGIFTYEPMGGVEVLEDEIACWGLLRCYETFSTKWSAIAKFHYNFDKVIFCYSWQSVTRCSDPLSHLGAPSSKSNNNRLGALPSKSSNNRETILHWELALRFFLRRNNIIALFSEA